MKKPDVPRPPKNSGTPINFVLDVGGKPRVKRPLLTLKKKQP